MYILNFIRGFCMALADSVPGVSGGTIAFILGFYDEFVDALNNLILGNYIDRIKSLRFLSKIGAGWIIGFIFSVLFITSIFERNIYDISSLFLGFIIASIPLIIKSELNTLNKDKKSIIYLIIGLILVGAITYFNPVSTTNYNLSIKIDNLNLIFIIYIFISGMIAISAMVLPGISGSTILLILGLYAPILTGIKYMINLKLDYIPGIAIFGCGILVGIFITVRGVRYLLKNFRSQTIYCIIGLMIGSIYAVIMGPTSLEVPREPMNLSNFSLILFIIGCTLVPLLEKFKNIIGNNNMEDLTS